MRKVIVTISAYNEERNLGGILDKLKTIQIPGCELATVVVDDGSSDGTYELSRRIGAHTLRHHVNLGQGHAVLTGFKAALLMAKSGDVIIEMDGDGQHNPDELHLFLEKMEQGHYDIVVGSRILGSNYDGAPFFRKKFLPVYTNIINRLTGYMMTDAMCGYRAFRASSLMKVSSVFDDMLEPQYLAAEMFLRFSRAGLTVGEVPIHLKERSSGMSYKGFVRYGLGVLKAIIKTFLDRSYHSLGKQ